MNFDRFERRLDRPFRKLLFNRSEMEGAPKNTWLLRGDLIYIWRPTRMAHAGRLVERRRILTDSNGPEA